MRSPLSDLSHDLIQREALDKVQVKGQRLPRAWRARPEDQGLAGCPTLCRDGGLGWRSPRAPAWTDSIPFQLV